MKVFIRMVFHSPHTVGCFFRFKDDSLLLTGLFESNITTLMKTIIAGFFLCSTLVPVGNAAEIVVNQSVPASDYSLNNTRSIFTMRQRFWLNGKKIKVFVLADNNPLHKTFTKNNLHMFPHQLRRVWDRMVFSGTGLAPIKLNTEDEMLEKISNTPYAIGYLNSGTENEKIRLFEYQ